MSVDSIRDRIVELENLLHNEKKGVIYRVIIDAVEKPLIECALRRTEGNQFKAARNLGINRNTMRAKIRKFGIDADEYKR